MRSENYDFFGVYRYKLVNKQKNMEASYVYIFAN